jgi:hypothetical protein
MDRWHGMDYARRGRVMAVYKFLAVSGMLLMILGLGTAAMGLIAGFVAGFWLALWAGLGLLAVGMLSFIFGFLPAAGMAADEARQAALRFREREEQ